MKHKDFVYTMRDLGRKRGAAETDTSSKRDRDFWVGGRGSGDQIFVVETPVVVIGLFILLGDGHVQA